MHLDADPDYYAWVGYITDEGRWVAHAREMALFGHVVNTEWLVHLLLAPVFQAGNFVVFTLLGVSLWTSRLLTAVSGGLILLLYWRGLCHVLAPRALLVGLALLAFEVDLLMLSRVAVPEVPAMLLELAVYLLLVLGRPARARLFGAGLLLLAMVGMKATTLFLVPIFSMLVLVQPLEPEADGRRWRRLLPFWAGFLSPLFLLVAALLFVWTVRPNVGTNLGILRGFIWLNTPYSIVAFPFETEFGPVFNMWALALCLVAVAWLARPGEPVDPQVRRVFLSAGAWALMYTALMVALGYFPDRYRVHVLLPMAVALAAGLTAVSTVSLQNIAETVRGLGSRSALALGLLSLPTAALWAPVLAGLAALAGQDPTRLRLKLLCLVIALAMTAWTIRAAAGSRPALVRFLVIHPIVGSLVWLVGLRTGLFDASFWPLPRSGALSWWVVGPWVSAAAATLLVRGGRAWSSDRWAALVPAAVLCYGALELARVAPSYIHPHYTMKQTSEVLGASLAGPRDVVIASRTEGLFNGNGLRYRSTLGRTWPRQKPERIVIAFRFDDPNGLLVREYDLVATYRLFVSPEYKDELLHTNDTVSGQELVKVYVRRRG
ncbi:MAG TPA: hypothetical protein VJX92_24735 [Methylomirabilota bacterium]|nr:hypothetical protein [Methylomirabilota bacterium]